MRQFWLATLLAAAVAACLMWYFFLNPESPTPSSESPESQTSAPRVQFVDISNRLPNLAPAEYRGASFVEFHFKKTVKAKV